MTSGAYTAPDGQVISTHWYQNSALKLNVEFKSIMNEWSTKAGATLLEGGAALLGGLAVVAEVVDYFDPTTYALNIPSTGGCSNGVCADMLYPIDSSMGSSNYAGGGFVLYPNKPNTNMMQSVYAK